MVGERNNIVGNNALLYNKSNLQDSIQIEWYNIKATDVSFPLLLNPSISWFQESIYMNAGLIRVQHGISIKRGMKTAGTEASERDEGRRLRVALFGLWCDRRRMQRSACTWGE